MESRPFTRLDWVVAVMTLLLIAGIPVSDILGKPLDVKALLPFAIAFSAIASSILIVWMAKGGANSKLWYWLPPFWPWGARVHSPQGRWFVVLAMVSGSVVGSIILLVHGVT